MTKFQQLLSAKQAVVALGAFDGLSARLVEMAGFECVYASGGAIARGAGYPDIGLLSMTEVIERVAMICDVTQLPVIADADTGFGNEVNTQRAIKLFARAGVAAVHIEDQEFPKRCGHLDDKTLIAPEEMVSKIQAAKEVSGDMGVIARTDAISVEGFEAALERSAQYVEAGADCIFVEAPVSIEQIERIADNVAGPKLLNMFYGGKTPLVPMERINSLGYDIVIMPSDLQRASIFAIEQTLAAIRQEGDSSSLRDQLTSFSERETIIQTDKYLNKGNET